MVFAKLSSHLTRTIETRGSGFSELYQPYVRFIKEQLVEILYIMRKWTNHVKDSASRDVRGPMRSKDEERQPMGDGPAVSSSASEMYY